MQVLVTSISVSFFFVLLPFTMGRLVNALLLPFQPTGAVAAQLLSGEPVIVGYMAMLSIFLAYLGRFATLRRDPVQAIAKKLSKGFLVVAVAVPYGLWSFSLKVWKNLYVVKDCLVLSLKFGVFPLVLGCWLDFCTLPIFGTTVSQRLELVSYCPFLMIIHWGNGLVCLLFVYNSMELIQKVTQFSFTSFFRKGTLF